MALTEGERWTDQVELFLAVLHSSAVGQVKRPFSPWPGKEARNGKC
jgi:hypothetical protein